MLKIKSSGKKTAKVVFELGPGEGDHSRVGGRRLQRLGPLRHPDEAPARRDAAGQGEDPGRCVSYQFKYLTDDGTWFCDPDTETEVNGEGDTNSVLRLP